MSFGESHGTGKKLHVKRGGYYFRVMGKYRW